MHCYEEFTVFYRLLLNHCYKVAMYSESSGRNQTEWLPEIKPAPHLSILKIPVCSKCVHEAWCIADNHCILSASSYWIVFAVPTKSQQGALGRTYWYRDSINNCPLLPTTSFTKWYIRKLRKCSMSSSTILEKLSFLERRTPLHHNQLEKKLVQNLQVSESPMWKAGVKSESLNFNKLPGNRCDEVFLFSMATLQHVLWKILNQLMCDLLKPNHSFFWTSVWKPQI